MSDSPSLKQKEIDFAFHWVLILKGAHALFEVIGSFLILFLNKDLVVHSVAFLTRGELAEEPTDLVANYLLRLAEQFSIGARDFAFLYLLSHGLIKLILIVALAKKKAWAYGASLVVFSVFICYQLYRYTQTHSPWLILFSVFDLVVIWLIVEERKENGAFETLKKA